jgi:conjugal transfer pilus assembly protein TraB
MRSSIRQRLARIADSLSPRARQWATIGAIALAGIAILWLVFAMGSGDGTPRIASPSTRGDTKPTNVDLMAPGAQVKPEEVWIGKAGRKLDSYEQEREDQRRINRERQEQHEALMRRFAELEAKLVGVTRAEPSMPAAVPVPPPISAAPPAHFPPDAALARSSSLPPPLPPPPPPPQQFGRAGMPPGAPPQPTLVRVTLASPAKPPDSGAEPGKPSAQNVDTFLPVSFTRGVLLGGLDAPTGGQAQTNPHPVLIRLADNSVLPNRYRAEYRECFVIAAGYGDISSERAYLRTESLSCVRPDGTALEVKIQGSVYGEDGKVGMRGRLITKQGQMLANALLAGVVSGIGQGLATSSTNVSTSPLGTITSASGADAYRAGLGTGVGRALDRLAQYYIKLAENTFPVIEVDAGREIDVVITKGVRIDVPMSAAAAAPLAVRPSNPEVPDDAND